ncbi:hypothetical protein CA13_70790 [Planctomycetes bacterium CA13]|uniref:Uncharacterized protein n=1 Tax=Novipirellula herctigrandis TaxID=2527986 RepID=A0A5C5YP20_9BACT|nr:hypothetical protein CA13_70790 [Planctomycetes bacterium CA13]
MIKRLFGHALLWVGFLAAAFVSLRQLELPEDKWDTIHWGHYAFAMAIGFVGVILLRIANRSADEDDEKTDAEYSVVQDSLAKVQTVIDRLCSGDSDHPSVVLHAIDNECTEPLSDFAEARGALVKRFGLETYANVMTEFAGAERYINRSWSAAADGYVDEVDLSLNRAKNHLTKASELLRTAEGSH